METHNSNKLIYRQGDVLIEAIDIKIKRHEKPEGRIVLAHGEVTFHAHEIHDLDAVDHFAAEDEKSASVMILALGRDAELQHQEHSTITLPKGTYRVTRQLEYTPQAIRNVAD